MTFDQQEPSAKSPCTKTTFFVFGDAWAPATRLSKGRAALAATASELGAISLRKGKTAGQALLQCDGALANVRQNTSV
jgi:hypothetical protein